VAGKGDLLQVTAWMKWLFTGREPSKTRQGSCKGRNDLEGQGGTLAIWKVFRDRLEVDTEGPASGAKQPGFHSSSTSYNCGQFT
jgi:hypothetical protein